MSENLIDDEERDWWDRASKVLAAVLYEVHERDWMAYANCEVTAPDDKSFITKPTPEEETRWATQCAHCPVFNECFDWANREDISGAFVAGEWRE